MATISISQLDTATQAKIDDLYEVAVVDGTSQTGYASRKLTAAQIATLIAQGVQFSGLSTEAKTIIAAINEASENGGTEVEANPAGEPTDTLEKIGIDGTIYGVGGSEPVSKTATGNPISITDAADAPIVSGEVTFEPVQDLHGYGKPWAGGAGKNKLPLTVDGIKALNTTGTWSGNVYSHNNATFELLTDTDNNIIGIKVNSSGTTGNAVLYLVPTGTSSLATYLSNGVSYKANGATSSSSFRFDVEFNGEWQTITSEGAITFTYTSGGEDRVRIFGATGSSINNLVFYPMIRLATETDPTFEPYSNICPIEGYTDCELEVTGKNLLQNKAVMPFILRGVTFTQNSDGSITANGTATNGDVILPLWARNTNNVHLPSGQYTYKACPSGGSVNTFYCQLQATRDDSLYEFGSDYGEGVTANVLSTDVMQATIRIVSGVTVNNVTFYPQLEKGLTATSYEPYQSTTYTIDLDGTRYGGTVNPVSGEMRVDRACFIGDGSSDENWNITGTGRLQLSDISNLKQYTDITNEYLTCSIAVKATSTANTGVITYSSGKLVLYLEGFKDRTLEDWKTYLSSNPVYICYELATPFTVQLTPEQIRTLDGTNNISTNMTGMSLEYITQEYQPLVELIERSAGHHYSENERVVGTWIDGKTLYEKSWNVSIEIPSASANTWLSTGILTASVNCDTVVGGKLVDNSNQFILGNIGFIQQNTYFAINVPIGNRTITTVTIQFTKTTD